MKIQFKYKPVIKPLYLREYHPDYGDETIEVCVNPAPAFLQQRSALSEENARRYAESAKAIEKKAENAAELVAAYMDWFNTEFNNRADEWFAKLWSFGADQWTAQELQVIKETDPHFLNWLKNRSVEMIEEHRLGRKKN